MVDHANPLRVLAVHCIRDLTETSRSTRSGSREVHISAIAYEKPSLLARRISDTWPASTTWAFDARSFDRPIDRRASGGGRNNETHYFYATIFQMSGCLCVCFPSASCSSISPSKTSNGLLKVELPARRSRPSLPFEAVEFEYRTMSTLSQWYEENAPCTRRNQALRPDLSYYYNTRVVVRLG
jgi:hypothetical protein